MAQENINAEPEELTPFEKIMKIDNIQDRINAIGKREKIVNDNIARDKIKLEEFKKNKPHLVKQKQESIAEKEAEVKKLKEARSSIQVDK